MQDSEDMGTHKDRDSAPAYFANQGIPGNNNYPMKIQSQIISHNNSL